MLKVAGNNKTPDWTMMDLGKVLKQLKKNNRFSVLPFLPGNPSNSETTGLD